MGRFRRSIWAARTFAYHAAYNALARASPRASAAIQRLTHDTGRGRGRDGARAAEYFAAVVNDYGVIARESGACGSTDLFRGKRVLEIGPGDTRAMALLARCEGAAAWEGFDAFDIQSRDARYTKAIYDALLLARGETRTARELLDGCIVHTSLASLERGGAVSGARFDVVISRAVLEHVRDLDALFATLARVTRRDAVLVHKVDLRAHGIEHDHALDFLRFSERAWRAMSSHVDLPNRVRVASYLELAERHGLRTAWARTTHAIDERDAAGVRSELAAPFCDASASELAMLGLWLVQVGEAHALARGPRVRFSDLEAAPRALLSRY